MKSTKTSSIAILVYIIAVHTHFVLSRHTRILGLPEHRIRHSHHLRVNNQIISNALQSNSDILDNAVAASESERVEELQRDILRSLGMSEPPANRVNIPDYMRNVIIQELDTAASEIAQQEQHFMKDSVNVLLTATKGWYSLLL